MFGDSDDDNSSHKVLLNHMSNNVIFWENIIQHDISAKQKAYHHLYVLLVLFD